MTACFVTYRALLDAGADLHSPDAKGLTPLYTAIEAGADEGVISLLKERGAELVSNAVKARKREDLIAWLAGHVNDLIEKRELIKAKGFIQCGVDMNLPAGFERRSNVVMAATVDGCAELLDWMLKNGGNPNATNRKGFTALGHGDRSRVFGRDAGAESRGGVDRRHGHDQASVHRVRHRRPPRRDWHTEQGEERFKGGWR